MSRGAKAAPLVTGGLHIAAGPGACVEFRDADGKALYEVRIAGDSLEIRGPGNDPLRGVTRDGAPVVLSSSLVAEWNASNCLTLNRKPIEL